MAAAATATRHLANARAGMQRIPGSHLPHALSGSCTTSKVVPRKLHVQVLWVTIWCTVRWTPLQSRECAGSPPILGIWHVHKSWRGADVGAERRESGRMCACPCMCPVYARGCSVPSADVGRGRIVFGGRGVWARGGRRAAESSCKFQARPDTSTAVLISTVMGKTRMTKPESGTDWYSRAEGRGRMAKNLKSQGRLHWPWRGRPDGDWSRAR